MDTDCPQKFSTLNGEVSCQTVLIEFLEMVDGLRLTRSFMSIFAAATLQRALRPLYQ